MQHSKNIYEGSLKTKEMLNLDFSENQITEIKDNSFNGLKKLQTLFLNRSQITELNENSFYGLKNLCVCKIIASNTQNFSRIGNP